MSKKTPLNSKRWIKVSYLNQVKFRVFILQDTFQKKSVLNFTHELNKDNKISFLDVFIDTNNNNNFTTSTYKKPCNNNSYTLNFKSECPFRYKKKQLLITWYPVPNWSPPPNDIL